MIVIYTNKDTVCVFNGKHITVDYSNFNTTRIYNDSNLIDEIGHSEVLWRFNDHDCCELANKFMTQIKEAKEAIPYVKDREKVYGGMLDVTLKVKIGELVDQTGEYVLCQRHYSYDDVIFAVHKNDIENNIKHYASTKLVEVLGQDMECKLKSLIYNYKALYEGVVKESKARDLIYRKSLAVFKHLKYNGHMKGLYEI